MYLAAAAARINASIQAKRGIQHVDVPPIRSVRAGHVFPSHSSHLLSSNHVYFSSKMLGNRLALLAQQLSTVICTLPMEIISKT